MNKRKLNRLLAEAYGKLPEADATPEDMREIRAYYDLRKARDGEPFLVDETTWRDLQMDEVFAKVNAAQSTAGEHVLYYLLRSPAVDGGEYARREKLIAYMEEEPQLRLRIARALWKLNKRRRVDIEAMFSPKPLEAKLLYLAPLLVLGLLGCAVGAIFAHVLLLPMIGLILVNSLYHEIMTQRLAAAFVTANYAASIARTAKRVAGLDPALCEMLPGFSDAVVKSGSLRRAGVTAATGGNDLLQVVSLFLLVDLLSFRRLRKQMAKHRDELFALHEALGRLDASIAVASYRCTLPRMTLPQIDFDESAPPRMDVTGLCHPLLSHPVPSDLVLTGSMLVTGSNASGKSTFLKSVALSAIMAQSVCTVSAEKYSATAFRIATSMAVTDSILDGDSYFVAEIKSIKRILDAKQRGERQLAIIDEVLRGTNTKERIAASTELLRDLAGGRGLIVAATHDGELCELLRDGYRMAHFEEEIRDGEILFDYKIKEGPATTRNAIRLLGIMGFPGDLVERAMARAGE